jgi:hypothetical protein
MIAQILNRPWRVSHEQAREINHDVLSRRKVLFGGAMVSAAVALSACSLTGPIDFATVGPIIANDVQLITSAFGSGLAELGALSGSLPAGWADVLGQVSKYVGDIGSIAGTISATSLVSTAGGNIANMVHDFNQIVQAIIANPAVAALVSGTGFGWALPAAAVLFQLIDEGVKLALSIATPPTPTPVPPVTPPAATARLRKRGIMGRRAPAHPMMAALAPAQMSTDVARAIRPPIYHQLF